MTVFNCGVLLILENEANGIHNNKSTISFTLYDALVSRRLKNQFSNFSECGRDNNTSRSANKPSCGFVNHILSFY